MQNWVFFIIIGLILQIVGVFCYYMSERQKKLFSRDAILVAAAARDPLVLILPINGPTETLPAYDAVVQMPSPPGYDSAPHQTLQQLENEPMRNQDQEAFELETRETAALEQELPPPLEQPPPQHQQQQSPIEANTSRPTYSTTTPVLASP
ncbi:hypothetical protein BGW38_000063 [Lunasporangiospora selenospora]|uniref:Uncharacterized protein n=1 Tax=Lunasporangiospora selenospora TaxID=979761 RepID=A0A9P6FW18_9FUNG|nr:hypothetical protein BGW38_000063 [Lunasporangiospora selenospora]